MSVEKFCIQIQIKPAQQSVASRGEMWQMWKSGLLDLSGIAFYCNCTTNHPLAGCEKHQRIDWGRESSFRWNRQTKGGRCWRALEWRPPEGSSRKRWNISSLFNLTRMGRVYKSKCVCMPLITPTFSPKGLLNQIWKDVRAHIFYIVGKRTMPNVKCAICQGAGKATYSGFFKEQVKYLFPFYGNKL